MKILKPYMSFIDGRGVFTGIDNSNDWKELNYVKTTAGQTRGKHYHKQTLELFIIISGNVEVRISSPIDQTISATHVFNKGDVFIVEPFEIHTFLAKTETEWINVLSQPMSSETPDIYSV